ncbi:MAG: exosome complex protein Rrp42 [Candidatus Heimdallarchaeota archaeon]
MAKGEQVLGPLEQRHIISLLKDGRRLDGRTPFEVRPFEISPAVIGKAEGSAQIQLGDTNLIVGVKGQVGAPFPDTPDQAVQIVNMELSPIASPFFEPGPPQKPAIELARVVDRGIRESKAVRLDDPSLVVKEGEYVWILFVDVYVIDHHGNLFDSSILAAMAALTQTQLKKKVVDEEGTLQEVEGETFPVPLNTLAASLTFGKIDDYIIADPSIEEERCLTERLTVTATEDGSVCSLQKGEAGAFTKDEIFQMLDIAQERIPKLLSTLKEQMNENP